MHPVETFTDVPTPWESITGCDVGSVCVDVMGCGVGYDRGCGSARGELLCIVCVGDMLHGWRHFDQACSIASSIRYV